MKTTNLTDFEINLLISLLHSEISQDKLLVATGSRWVNSRLKEVVLDDLKSKEGLMYKLESLWNTNDGEYHE